MTRVEYNALFMEELRAFEGLERKQILSNMRTIERTPFASDPNRVHLPPMWRPGTIEAHFGDIAIRYYALRDDEVGITTVVFLRIFRRPTFGGFDPDVM